MVGNDREFINVNLPHLRLIGSTALGDDLHGIDVRGDDDFPLAVGATADPKGIVWAYVPPCELTVTVSTMPGPNPPPGQVLHQGVIVPTKDYNWYSTPEVSTI